MHGEPAGLPPQSWPAHSRGLQPLAAAARVAVSWQQRKSVIAVGVVVFVFCLVLRLQNVCEPNAMVNGEDIYEKYTKCHGVCLEKCSMGERFTEVKFIKTIFDWQNVLYLIQIAITVLVCKQAFIATFEVIAADKQARLAHASVPRVPPVIAPPGVTPLSRSRSRCALSTGRMNWARSRR